MTFVRVTPASGARRLVPNRRAPPTSCRTAAPNYRRRGGNFKQLLRPSLLDFMMEIPDFHSAVEARFPSTQDFFQLSPVRRIPVSVTEEKDSFKVTAEVPGVPKEDISIDIEGNTLTISVTSSKGQDQDAGAEEDEAGKQQKEEEGDAGVEVTEKEARVVDGERQWEYVARVLQLPDSADVGAVSASCANGVLSLSIPKLAASMPSRRSIAIE